MTNREIALSRDRASNLMKKLSLVSCQLPKNAYKKVTQEYISIPNMLNSRLAITQLNQFWCGDVTCVWVGDSWTYLAVIIDLFSRKPISWAL